MASTIHKTVPIGYQYHQIEVPEWTPALALPCILLPIKRAKSCRCLRVRPSTCAAACRNKNWRSSWPSWRATTRRKYQTTSRRVTSFPDGATHLGSSAPHGALLPSFTLSLLILGVVSRDRTRSRAMELLHNMGYNYTKAKFYLIFPYYITYNRFRAHQPLALTDTEMARRITEHLEGLKSTKEKEL